MENEAQQHRAWVNNLIWVCHWVDVDHLVQWRQPTNWKYQNNWPKNMCISTPATRDSSPKYFPSSWRLLSFWIYQHFIHNLFEKMTKLLSVLREIYKNVGKNIRNNIPWVFRTKLINRIGVENIWESINKNVYTRVQLNQRPMKNVEHSNMNECRKYLRQPIIKLRTAWELC